MAQNFEGLAEKAVELGATEAKVAPKEVLVFDPRSFLKCRFGCQRWGKYWTCPPNLNLSPEQFQDAFERYSHVLVLRTADPKVGQEVALAIEKEAMLQYGAPFSFALALCVMCEECAYPEPCRFPHLARPSADAFGLDFGPTLDKLNFKLDFDAEGKLQPTWYSLVLLG